MIPLVEVKKEEPKAPEVLVQPLESETQTPSVSSVPMSEPVPESESESGKEECTVMNILINFFLQGARP